MLKNDLRKKYKALRNLLTHEEIEQKSLAIANQLLALNIWDKSYYHLFLTIETLKEVETQFVLQVLAGKDKEIVIAKSDFSTLSMTHYLLTDNTKIKKNKFNIPEPIDGLEVPVLKIDVVFIPLLAFDENGNRVGYGKGFYDSFLSNCKKDVIKIGLSFFEAEALIIDVFQTDVKLDYAITPNKIYTF
jgi:5-formyltetrahydrofolate cyclo-ligase